MILSLSISFALLAATVLIHAFGLALMMRWLPLAKASADLRVRWRAWLLIRLAACVVLIHWLEISVWAIFYYWQQYLPTLELSLYFSIVTYTTVGYGDVVLPLGSRLLAGVEALTGIIMCGWSTAFFFASVSKVYTFGSDRSRDRTDLPD